MKVLYIGYYKENSDWGEFARNNILALDQAGVDVACKAIQFTATQTPTGLQRFENKNIDDCDVCIQHVFPEHMLATSKFKKNIGILSNDFYEINHSAWIEKLDRMDEIWVPSPRSKEILDKTTLGDKTKVVPLAIKTDIYQNSQSSIDGGVENNNKFKFYTIVNSIESIEQVLRCFHSEFDNTDDTVLLLGVDESHDGSTADAQIEKIKNSLGLKVKASDYRKDVFVQKVNGNHNMLHTYADCYVSSSNQRSLSLDEFHAMAFGNTPIIFKQTDAENYFGDKYAVSTIYTVNQNHSKMWPDVNNGYDYKIAGCDLEIKALMRSQYELWRKNPVIYGINNKKEAMEKTKQFSLTSVGNIIKETINV